MIIRTTALDQAAFFKFWGAKVITIDGKFLDNTFVLSTNRLVMWYEKHIGWVPYKHFCQERKNLKYMTRKRDGLPAHFTGHRKSGFRLEDVAYIKETKTKH